MRCRFYAAKHTTETHLGLNHEKLTIDMTNKLFQVQKMQRIGEMHANAYPELLSIAKLKDQKTDVGYLVEWVSRH